MRKYLFCLSVLLLLGSMGERGLAADRPNVLIVMADDCTYSDLPLHGGKKRNHAPFG